MKRVIGLIALACVGCFDTSATVPFVQADSGHDSSSADVISTDADEDVRDVRQDLGPLYPREQLPRGTTCDDVPADPPEYDCNPVLQDCPSGEVCEIQIQGTFRLVCRAPQPGETFLIPDGGVCDESSTTERCRLGARCISGRCRALCEFTDAVGCREVEFCETISDDPLPGGDVLLGYGACIAACR